MPASALRRPLLLNPSAAAGCASSSEPSSPLPAPATTTPPASAISAFHAGLPGYSESPLVAVPSAAASLGVRAVLVKDEGARFGLPSFKALGVAWGAWRLLAARLGLPVEAGLGAARARLGRGGGGEEGVAGGGERVTFVAATDGNHGRIVARVGAWFGLDVKVVVPSGVEAETVEGVRREGATVVEVEGKYEDALEAAFEMARDRGYILVEHTPFPGFEDTPSWFMDGYGTMLVEVDAQLAFVLDVSAPSLVVVPVGVGGLARAVVTHYKHSLPSTDGRTTRILTVEPDTAGCLYASVRCGVSTAPPLACTSVPPRSSPPVPSLMAGLDYPAVSPLSWPVLHRGVDACLTVSDREAFDAALHLRSAVGLDVGPSGAATVAALLRLTPADRAALGLDADSVVVCLSTERGSTAPSMAPPRDVSMDDPALVAQALVRIDSSVPSDDGGGGPGEAEAARFVAAWLQHRDVDAYWVEGAGSREVGRPSVVGVVRRGITTAGTGKGRTLMLNGHLDTVTLASYDGAVCGPLDGEIRAVAADSGSGERHPRRLYGRGAADMKGGLAAMLVAAVRARHAEPPIGGTLVVAAVADEEDRSVGTELVLAALSRGRPCAIPGLTPAATAALDVSDESGASSPPRDRAVVIDGAVVCEPTGEDVVVGHKGFAWFALSVHGRAAHGSRPDLGVDAVARAGYVLAELDLYARRLLLRRPNTPPGVEDGRGNQQQQGQPSAGPPSVHASVIRGGEEASSYAAGCALTVERRTVAGETDEGVLAEMKAVVARAADGMRSVAREVRAEGIGPRQGGVDGADEEKGLGEGDEELECEVAMTFSRPPFEIGVEHELVRLVKEQIDKVRGRDDAGEVQLRAETFWTDCALIAAEGVPVVMYGPHGEGLHAKEEWVDLDSVDRVAETLFAVCRQFCGGAS